MRAVCYIPAIECLVHRSISYWTDAFESRAEQAPTDIVLPAFTNIGSSYSSNYGSPEERLGQENTLAHWVQQARELVSNVKVWASVFVTVPSLSNDMIALRDQWDQVMGDACIVNPHVQRILAEIFSEVRNLGVDGVVLDITDAFPNSTSDRYRPIRKEFNRPMQNTCFCSYCVEAMRHDGHWIDGPEPFQDIDRNLTRFVLQPTATDEGATPNLVKDRWLETLDGPSLAKFSDARGFTVVENEADRKDAVKLLRYLTGRATVTAIAVRRLGESAAREGLQTAAVLGSGIYDMSQNVNLVTLVKKSSVDEYWSPSFEMSHFREDGPVLLRFLGARGSYYYNGLFEQLDSACRNRVAVGKDLDIRQLVKRVASLAYPDEFTKGQCAQVKLFKGLHGYVGVPFHKRECIDVLNRRFADGSLPAGVRDSLISLLESGRAPSLGGGDTSTVNASPWE